MKKEKDGEMSGKLNSLENRRILDYVKAVRKKSREEEIQLYGKPLPKTKIKESKKIYKRNKKWMYWIFFTRSSLHSVMNSV